jgi:hypothetical protein
MRTFVNGYEEPATTGFGSGREAIGGSERERERGLLVGDAVYWLGN